jgi:hypothetical protein
MASPNLTPGPSPNERHIWRGEQEGKYAFEEKGLRSEKEKWNNFHGC